MRPIEMQVREGTLCVSADNGDITLGSIGDWGTTVWESAKMEVYATSCFIETEASQAIHQRTGNPILEERRTTLTFGLRDGRTLTVHLLPSADSQPNWMSTLIVDDLVQKDNDTSDNEVDLDSII